MKPARSVNRVVRIGEKRVFNMRELGLAIAESAGFGRRPIDMPFEITVGIYIFWIMAFVGFQFLTNLYKTVPRSLLTQLFIIFGLAARNHSCGMDYEGGGTYFECLDATLHLQRGHALIFPGKLRHCGQRITAGLRFLLVGFLVDKTAKPAPLTNDDSNGPDAGIAAHLSNYQ